MYIWLKWGQKVCFGERDKNILGFINIWNFQENRVVCQNHDPRHPENFYSRCAVVVSHNHNFRRQLLPPHPVSWFWVTNPYHSPYKMWPHSSSMYFNTEDGSKMFVRQQNRTSQPMNILLYFHGKLKSHSLCGFSFYTIQYNDRILCVRQ